MRLSEHFTLAEMTASEVARQRGIANNPGPRAIAALTALCVNVLEPVRLHYARPVKATSGYRSPELNRAVGGSRTSQHVHGEAADFRVPGVSNLDVCRWIAAELQFDQLIYEFGERGWIHVSWREGRLRGSVLTARQGWGRTRYLKGLVP